MQSTHVKTANPNANDPATCRRKEAKLNVAIAAIENGIGYSSDQSLAAYFNTSRSTIWAWARAGKLPRPIKLSTAMSRWSNAEIKTWPGRIA